MKTEAINSEVRTKDLFRNIAYTGWILFVTFLVLWVFEVINTKASAGLILSGMLGLVFTVLTARKKIPGEDSDTARGTEAKIP